MLYIGCLMFSKLLFAEKLHSITWVHLGIMLPLGLRQSTGLRQHQIYLEVAISMPS